MLSPCALKCVAISLYCIAIMLWPHRSTRGEWSETERSTPLMLVKVPHLHWMSKMAMTTVTKTARYALETQQHGSEYHDNALRFRVDSDFTSQLWPKFISFRSSLLYWMSKMPMTTAMNKARYTLTLSTIPLYVTHVYCSSHLHWMYEPTLKSVVLHVPPYFHSCHHHRMIKMILTTAMKIAILTQLHHTVMCATTALYTHFYITVVTNPVTPILSVVPRHH